MNNNNNIAEQNKKLLCIIFKETNNYLLKLLEEENISSFKNEMLKNKIKFSKFIEYAYETEFEINPQNLDYNTTKEGYFNSIFPDDIFYFIQKNLLE